MGNSVSMEAVTNPFAFPAILAVNKNQTAKNAKSAEEIEVRFNTQSFTKNLCDLCG